MGRGKEGSKLIEKGRRRGGKTVRKRGKGGMEVIDREGLAVASKIISGAQILTLHQLFELFTLTNL